jgi:hypothetical protein
MKSLGCFSLGLFFLFAMPASAVRAQSPGPPEPSKSEPAPEKGLRNLVYEARHRDVVDLSAAVRVLGSGVRGAALSFSREFRTITVRDLPENVAAIEAALKRLDVPEPPRADVELHLYVLVASHAPATAGRIPEELGRAIEALKATLQYKTYSLAASFTERVRDGSREIHGEGVAEIDDDRGGKPGKRVMQAEYGINQLSVDREGSAGRIRLDGFKLALVGGGGRAQLRTDVTLADGEKVVVGTSTVQDKGLVVVLSARVIR